MRIRDDLVDEALTHTEGEPEVLRGDVALVAEGVHRSAAPDRVARGECEVVGSERFLHDHVDASGSLQSHDVPFAVQLELRPLDDSDANVGGTIADRGEENPFGVRHTTRILPTTREHDPTVGRAKGSSGRRHGGEERRCIVGEQHVDPLLAEHCPSDTRGTGVVETGPGRRRIPVRQAFEKCELIDEMQMVPADFDRGLDHRHPESSHEVDELG